MEKSNELKNEIDFSKIYSHRITNFDVIHVKKDNCVVELSRKEQYIEDPYCISESDIRFVSTRIVKSGLSITHKELVIFVFGTKKKKCYQIPVKKLRELVEKENEFVKYMTDKNWCNLAVIDKDYLISHCELMTKEMVDDNEPL